MSVVFKKTRAGLLGIVLSQMAGASGVGEAYPYIRSKIEVGVPQGLMSNGKYYSQEKSTLSESDIKQLDQLAFVNKTYPSDEAWDKETETVLTKLSNQEELLREVIEQHNIDVKNDPDLRIGLEKLDFMRGCINGLLSKSFQIDQILLMLLYNRLVVSTNLKVVNQETDRVMQLFEGVFNLLKLAASVSTEEFPEEDQALRKYDLINQSYHFADKMIITLASRIDLSSSHGMVKAFILANVSLHNSFLLRTPPKMTKDYFMDRLKTDVGGSEVDGMIINLAKKMLYKKDLINQNDNFEAELMLAHVSDIATLKLWEKEEDAPGFGWIFWDLMAATGSPLYSEENSLSALRERFKNCKAYKQIESKFLNKTQTDVVAQWKERLTKEKDKVKREIRNLFNAGKGEELIEKVSMYYTLTERPVLNKEEIQAIKTEKTAPAILYEKRYEKFFSNYTVPKLSRDNIEKFSENTMDNELISLQHDNNEIDLNMSNSKPISLSPNESENISHKTNEDIPDDSCLIDSYWGDKQQAQEAWKNKKVQKNKKEFNQTKPNKQISTVSNVNTELLSDNFNSTQNAGKLKEEIMAEFNLHKIMTYNVFNQLWQRLGGKIMPGSGSHKKLVNRNNKVVGGIFMHKRTQEYGSNTRLILQGVLSDELKRMQSIESQSV